jgi:uncharacterized membrane protein YphA (DoxX/SURF4 family)
MENLPSIAVLIFLALTFLQSGYDKLFHWKDNVEWLKGHFSKTFLKNHVPLALFKILVLEILSGILSLAGVFQLFVHNDSSLGYYASAMSALTLLFLLFGQRVAKDYDGARTIVIYFIPTILLLHWLS